ncbi:hypothetical protein NDU88_006840 [Pleurodeles waltl]|uniref:Uncharacterized protein n=1 Tax=Pleurodeles waltl TaxID=8319 RepID=A0AAV7U1M2_PLEWA|nr:hypothetical protein NDU88_006840 [Pleurodeles waltl]
MRHVLKNEIESPEAPALASMYAERPSPTPVPRAAENVGEVRAGTHYLKSLCCGMRRPRRKRAGREEKRSGGWLSCPRGLSLFSPARRELEGSDRLSFPPSITLRLQLFKGVR